MADAKGPRYLPKCCTFEVLGLCREKGSFAHVDTLLRIGPR